LRVIFRDVHERRADGYYAANFQIPYKTSFLGSFLFSFRSPPVSPTPSCFSFFLREASGVLSLPRRRSSLNHVLLCHLLDLQKKNPMFLLFSCESPFLSGLKLGKFCLAVFNVGFFVIVPMAGKDEEERPPPLANNSFFSFSFLFHVPNLSYPDLHLFFYGCFNTPGEFTSFPYSTQGLRIGYQT